MDASGSGYGVVSERDWLAGAWKSDLDAIHDTHSHLCHAPGDEVPSNINVQELYPLLEAFWRWGYLWRDCKVVVNCDNTQVVTGLNTGRSDNPVAMNFLRRIFWLSVLFNCHVVCVHIPGKLNVQADALSRLLENNSCIPSGFCCCRCMPVASDPG